MPKSSTPLRRGSVILTLFAALAIAGCSDDDPEPAETLTPAPTLTPTPDATAEAIAQITDVYDQWWDATIAATNAGSLDPAPFEGIASDIAINEQLLVVRQLNDGGITRSGEPEVAEPQITVDGETARVEGCVDESGWAVTVDGEEMPADDRGATPRVFDYANQNGTWVVAALVAQQEATITC